MPLPLSQQQAHTLALKQVPDPGHRKSSALTQVLEVESKTEDPVYFKRCGTDPGLTLLACGTDVGRVQLWKLNWDPETDAMQPEACPPLQVNANTVVSALSSYCT